MMANRFKYEITADDKTAKGVKSAEKGLGKLNSATKSYAKESQKAAKAGLGGGSGLAQTKGKMVQVKSATGRLLATAPGLSRYTSILGGVHDATTKAAGGMREAAQSGSGLGAALGGVAAMGGGVIGIVGALTAGAVKMAAGWAEGSAQLGRLSAGIGVTTGDLQKLQAVGELSGVSKDDVTGALGGVASTLHEAKAGRNQEAAGAMLQLHLQPKAGANGLPDSVAFLKDLADVISIQTDPMTQARMAGQFGATSVLPMLRQGGKAISAGMDEAGKYAAVRSDTSVVNGSRAWRKGVQLSQLGGRAAMLADEKATMLAEPGLDGSIAGMRAGFDGRGAQAAGRVVNGAAAAGVTVLGGAARWAGGEVAGFGGVVAGAFGQIKRAAEAGEKKWGVPARVTEAQYNLESGFGRHMPNGSNTSRPKY